MVLRTQPTILLIGMDANLGYLLARFAEHSGYQSNIRGELGSSREITSMKPAVIIFLSTELLARDQTVIAELTNLEAPILVCSSAVEEARARELGADYCLLHPLTYNDFQTALSTVITSKHS